MSQNAKNTENQSPSDTAPIGRRNFLEGVVAGGVVGGIVAGAGVWKARNAAEPTQKGPGINARLFTFVGGETGAWNIVESKTIIGEPLPKANRLDIVNGPVPVLPPGAQWRLQGVTSNERYATRVEKDQLVAKQASLGRPESTYAAMIPIKKNAKWWGLTQDERRAIFEERSHHVKIGMKYLPAVARRLHHCRDLNEAEPFDFVTLFDYTKADATAFDDMLAELRGSEEWAFVEREVDLRLVRG